MGVPIAPTADPAGPLVTPRSIAIDLPMSGQAAVCTVARAIPRDDPAYYPLLVANAVLGGSYSSRLNNEIRVERGLSYGAGSRFRALLQSGAIAAGAQTRNDAVAEVARLMLGQIGKLSTGLVGDELKARQATLLGSFALEIETVDGAEQHIADFVLYDRPLSELSAYATNVRNVTPEQLEAALAASLAPSKTSLIVVGDAQTFGAELLADHPELEQISIDELSLDSVALQATNAPRLR